MTWRSGPRCWKRCLRCGCSRLVSPATRQCYWCCQGELSAGLSQPKITRDTARTTKQPLTQVEARPDEAFDTLVRRFVRAVRHAGVLREAKVRQWYRSPAERRRLAAWRARRVVTSP